MDSISSECCNLLHCSLTHSLSWLVGDLQRREERERDRERKKRKKMSMRLLVFCKRLAYIVFLVFHYDVLHQIFSRTDLAFNLVASSNAVRFTF